MVRPTPTFLENFYENVDKDYGKQRDLDALYATKLCGYEVVFLPSLRNRESGVVGVAPLKYNWFYNKIGTELAYDYVVGPDCRLPRFTTDFEDSIELAKCIGLKKLPVATTEELLKYILNEADKLL